MDLVYLDNNATTQPAPEVVEAMRRCLHEYWGNPSSVHRFGQLARKAVDEARGQVASLIGAAEREITFTGGGTESINTAVRGLLAARSPRRVLVTSSVEHSAGHELAKQLESECVRIITIAVDRGGALDMQQLADSLSDEVALVSIMWANNETGVLFPMSEIAQICRERKVPLHTDATQAVGKVLVNVKEVGVDAMSFAAHKFHGPKGVGGLYVRRGLRIRPWLVGGPQESGRRGGTENVPGIVGMGTAALSAREALPQMVRVADLRDRLERGVLGAVADTHVNGRVDSRLPNTTNIGFAYLEAEAILLLLSEQGICASAGAACSSGSLEPSHVLRAMAVEEPIAHGAVRFSLSRYTSEGEIDRTLGVLPSLIERLRRVLPR